MGGEDDWILDPRRHPDCDQLCIREYADVGDVVTRLLCDLCSSHGLEERAICLRPTVGRTSRKKRRKSLEHAMIGDLTERLYRCAPHVGQGIVARKRSAL